MPKIDIALLGTGIAGLLTAVELSKSGKKIVVFDAAREPGGRAVHFDVSGRRYRAVPHPLYGIEREGLLWQLCAKAGIPEIPLKPATAYQVVLPDRRITIFPSVDETLEELQREFPAEENKFRKLYRYAGEQAVKASKSAFTSYLLRRRSGHDFLKSLQISNELYTVFDVQSRILLGRPVSEIRLEALVLLLTKAPRTPQDGFSWLAKRLCEQLVKNGGELRLATPWPSLLHRSKRAYGLQTEAETMETKAVIVNAVETREERRLLLYLRSEVIPEEMKDAVCCLSHYEKIDELFSLALDKTKDGADPDAVPVSAVFPGISTDRVPRMQLMERISRIMPFLNDFVLSEQEDDPDVRRYPMELQSLPLKTRSFFRDNPFRATGLKNLYLVPDNSAISMESVQTSQVLARLLS